MEQGLLNGDIERDVEAVIKISAVATILDVACATTGMGFAAVARVTADRWIACSVRDNIQFGLRPGAELKVETTICHEIRQHGEAVIIDDVNQDAIYCGHPTPARYGFRSYISVPIVMPDGRFFGTLCAIDPKPRKLRTSEIIGSFKLFAELIAFHLDAHARLARAEAVLAQERELSELREQFIAVLGHDLRNPLAAVRAGVTMLSRKPERAVEITPQIESSIGRMSGLIDDVMDFARGRLGSGLALQLNGDGLLEPTLRQVVDELQATHPDRSVTLDLAFKEPVRCDPGRVAQLLSNLLANALTYSPAAQPVLVRASALDGMFDLSVANAGEPIPPAMMPMLFQPFFRGALSRNQQGLGLGLYIASEIARAHGGQLGVTSTADETRFTLRMPTGS